MSAGSEIAREESTKAVAQTRSPQFFGNRHVYAVIFPRARGLTVGVNLNADQQCNLDCFESDVAPAQLAPVSEVDLHVLSTELESMLHEIHDGVLQQRTPLADLPPDLLQLRHVMLTGHPEPTLSPQFRQAVETVVHVRAVAGVPFFKIVLLTDASHLGVPEVLEGIRLFTRQDEIWIRLAIANQPGVSPLNETAARLEKSSADVLQLARQREVVIQSLFPQIAGKCPEPGEIEAYAMRLRELKNAGARISSVQVYSASPSPHRPQMNHLPLSVLSEIARTVRRVTGLPTEVF